MNNVHTATPEASKIRFVPKPPFAIDELLAEPHDLQTVGKVIDVYRADNDWRVTIEFCEGHSFDANANRFVRVELTGETIGDMWRSR